MASAWSSSAIASSQRRPESASSPRSAWHLPTYFADTVELHGPLEIAELLVEPAQAVGDAADVVVTLPLPGLDEGLVEHRARFRVPPAADVSQAQAPLP